MMRRLLPVALICAIATGAAADNSQPLVLNVWPDKPPGEEKQLPPEADQTKPEDKLIAGRRIIKLGNVSVPQIAIYPAPPESNTGAAVVVCPGGGHHILAYDLEGVEVAEWLNSIGVTGIVLKYRVPFRDPENRSLAAVQDAQRAMSLVRNHAEQWKIDPNRIGICGFSAGGETAALASIRHAQRQYDNVDAIDMVSRRPDFAMLIYAAGLVDKQTVAEHPALLDSIKIDGSVPPMFLVHAFDDNVSAQNPLLLASALKKSDVPVELHLFAHGGHGYGLRETELPVTRWPVAAEHWLKRMQFLKRP